MTWERVPLKDVGTWFGGGTPSKSNGTFWTDGTIPWLSPKDMGREVLASTQDHITAAAVEGSAVRLVPLGSVAVVVRSGILERTIPVSLVPFETTLNQDMKAVQPRAGIDPRWIAWGLRAFERDLLRDTRKAGTTVASIEWPRFQAFEIPVPPLDEQRRIVDLLEDHLSRLDAAQDLLRRNEARAVAVQEAWLRSRLGQRGDGESLRIGDVLASVKGGWSRSARHLIDSNDGVPYLKMNNLTRRGRLDLREVVHVEADHDALAKYGVEPGDVLFNSKNSGDLIGKTALADSRVTGSVINENIMRLRFDARVVPEFAAIWFLGPQMRRCITDAASASTNVAAVYQKDLVTFPIWVPPHEMQHRLAAEFDAIRIGAERLQSELAAAHRRAGLLRRTLLTAAFSGRLTDAQSDQSAAEERIGA